MLPCSKDPSLPEVLFVEIFLSIEVDFFFIISFLRMGKGKRGRGTGEFRFGGIFFEDNGCCVPT